MHDLTAAVGELEFDGLAGAECLVGDGYDLGGALSVARGRLMKERLPGLSCQQRDATGGAVVTHPKNNILNRHLAFLAQRCEAGRRQTESNGNED